MFKKEVEKKSLLRKDIFTGLFLFLFFALPQTGYSQNGGFFEENLHFVVIGLLVLIMVILLFVVIILGDRLVKGTARKTSSEIGGDEDEAEEKYPMMPKLLPDRKAKSPVQIIKLDRGFDVHIKGRAEKKIKDHFPATYSLSTASFKVISPIPKVEFQIGDQVKAGDALYFDKKRPEIIYSAPVSGELVEIRRGEKRKITEVVILADKQISYKDFGVANPNDLKLEEITERMLTSGVWPLIRQRPFNIIADPNDPPKMVYISCFDTSPLAPDYDFMMDGKGREFQAGIDVLRRFTEGGVHLGLNAKKVHSKTFAETKGVHRHWFEGAHPAGNVGVQIHHVNPINKGETVWTINPQDVLIIGRLFLEGRYNCEKIISVNGPEVLNPQYYRTRIGANIEALVDGNLATDHVRYISGNALTGDRIERNGFLRYYHDMLTVILEGDQYEFMGWLLPSYPRPSFSPTFLSYYFQGEEHRVNTNLHGEERAFVVTGKYEEVLPMDIFPMQLMKACIVEDFELMEGLGIYEVDEEDFALCEFICPSKTNCQAIIRKGSELIRTQG